MIFQKPRVSTICTAVAGTAILPDFLQLPTIAVSIMTVEAALMAVARSRRGRELHSSSPSIARVDHACSVLGFRKSTGLMSIHADTATAALLLLRQKGTMTRGVVAQRDQALRGFECRAKTFRFREALTRLALGETLR